MYEVSTFLHILAKTYDLFLTIAVAILGCEVFLIMVLICTSLMTNDVKHLFMRLLAIHI